MENGTWNFLEPRKKNISDVSQGMDHLMFLSVSVAKIFLYLKIYKHISKTFNLASLKDNERRKKFKKVHNIYYLIICHFLGPIGPLAVALSVCKYVCNTHKKTL